MKVTRSLLLILCALALQGCITYYYPAYAPGEDEYYAEDDYATEAEYYEYEGETYDLGTPVVDLRVASAAYYPWRSLDYYYLGPHYYRPQYLGYTSGWYSSFGYLHSYPPYYSPYGVYGPLFYPSPFLNVYEPWYDPWYGWPGYVNAPRFIWYDSYWNGRYQTNTGQDSPNSDYQEGFGVSRSDVRLGDLGNSFADPRDRANYQPGRVQDKETVSRTISMSPSSRSGEQGMEVRSRRARKIEDPHIGPAPVISKSVSQRSARSISVAPPRQRPPAEGVSRPIASTPRVVRQIQPRQAMTPRPGASPSRSNIPLPTPGDAPSPYPKAGSNRKN